MDKNDEYYFKCVTRIKRDGERENTHYQMILRKLL